MTGWHGFWERKGGGQDEVPVVGAPVTARLTVNLGVLAVGPVARDEAVATVVSEAVRHTRKTLESCLRNWPWGTHSPRVRVLGAPSGEMELAALHAARAVGAEIQLSLPAAVPAIAETLDKRARALFDALLMETEAVACLDGAPDSAWAQKTAVRILLDNVQVLILAGDPRSLAERERLADLCNAAEEAGVAVLRVDGNGAASIDPEASGDASWRERLAACIRHVTAPGTVPRQVLRARVPEAVLDRVRAEWLADWKGADATEALTHAIDAPLLRHYAWSDWMACREGSAYRRLGRARLCCIFAAALCVAVAFYGPETRPLVGLLDRLHALPILRSVPETPRMLADAGFALQCLFIGAALAAVAFNERARWHANLLDFRLLAELLRIARLSRFTGRRLCSHQLEHLEVDAHPEWVLALFSAVQRDAGLAPLKADQDTRAACSVFARNIIGGQQHYQGSTAEGHRKRRVRLAWGKSVCLVVGMGAILIRLGVVSWGDPQNRALWYVAVKASTTVFPGLAGLFFGWSAFGAHDALAQRARRMAECLGRATRELSRSGPPETPMLWRTVWDASVLMASEVLGWRGILKGKSISLSI